MTTASLTPQLAMSIQPVILEGARVRLEPLTMNHLDALSEFALDPELWRWMPYVVRTREELCDYLHVLLDAQAAGTSLPFAIIEPTSACVAGATRFMNIDSPNRRVEIGGTIVALQWQRTFVNTEAKYLMLRHAFESWGVIRVEFKADSLNVRSRQAILRLGAREEGTLRNHMIMPSGRIRDSVYFSILNSEWPAVKRNLEARLHH